MKIALDAMGGDFAPLINIQGAKAALAEYKEITKIFLVGDEQELRKLCSSEGLGGDKIEFVHASQVVEMNESGASTLRSKKNSSISVATDLVKSGRADAVVSAGNTGAAVANATLKLRTIKGIERAGICSPLPNEFGTCNLLDAGANPDAKPEHLLGYAIMGAIYAKEVQGIESPTVGIMSNGEEDEKGTAFTKETFKLLSEFVATKKAPFEFLGNVEGRDLFETKLDVCLCEGFTGNIVLKTVESTAKIFSKWLKVEIARNPLRMIGASLAKGAFKELKGRTNYETYGGSPLLGVKGVCIIAHGSSSGFAMKNAIRVACETSKNNVNPHIEEALAKLDLS
jgi:phosphate acyltransferase